VLIAEIRDTANADVVVARAFEPLTQAVIRQLLDLQIKTVKVIDIKDDDTIIKCLKKDPTHDTEEALKDIYRRLRPGDPPTVTNAKALLKRLFFDPKRYDIGRVGRYKINQKLTIDVDLETRIITNEDIVAATQYVINLRRGEGSTDDIDHLGSRRVRTVGELLANQCRTGLSRTERLVKERMTLFDVNTEGMTPQKLINPKALSAVIRDFFGRSQLSQFMDQTNPLAELTHKRRLSALGPGGLSRDRAGFEVRDVHPSHYGRICPIETPEGPNIGLISSMSCFSRINEFGFIETPYRKVTNGKVTDQVDYLTADQEENFIVAQANAPVTTATASSPSRKSRSATRATSSKSNRTGQLHGRLAQAARLRGRQPHPVPRARRREPRAHGLEHATPGRAADQDGSAARRHRHGGQGRPRFQGRHRRGRQRQGRLGHRQLHHHHPDGEMPEGKKKLKHDPEEGIYVYELRKYMRSNAGTCMNQKPLVKKGQKISKGQVIATVPAPTTANSRSAATCSSRSCRGTATTSRTPS
jgi:DNA-directed RNA polymerase subunit beta